MDHLKFARENAEGLDLEAGNILEMGSTNKEQDFA